MIHKAKNINFEDTPIEFPMTKAALQTIERVMVEQDDFGFKKYGKPLNWRDKYNWREMKLQELADFLKYEECEYMDKQEAIRILKSGLIVKPLNKDLFIKSALEVLEKSFTGK